MSGSRQPEVGCAALFDRAVGARPFGDEVDDVAVGVFERFDVGSVDERHASAVLDAAVPPDVLEVRDVEVRPAGENEVRIAVQAAAVNPTDIATRSGLVAAAYQDFDPPYIAGMDAAGVIESVGPGASSDRFTVGDEVMAIVMPRRPEGGAHSELIVVPEAAVVHKPSALTMEQAAMLPMNGLTALEALATLDLKPGSTLAITGGSGYLAAFVMTLARRRGIRVIADGRPRGRDDSQSRRG